MRSLTLVVLCVLLIDVQRYATKAQSCEFRVGGVSYLSGSLQSIGEQIAAGYKMAMHDYAEGQLHDMEYLTSHITKLSENSNETLCSLSMDLRDIETDIKVGIVEIFDLSSTYDSCADDFEQSCSINMPFVVGPATSGDCLTTNPLVEAFDLLQFSASATSTVLSSYTSFYRTIPSDDTQASALIQMCSFFDWQLVGILYMSSQYGTSLQRALTSYANSADIKTTTFSYISGDNVTMTDAVEAMHDSNIFVFILIVYDGDVDLLSHLLENVHAMIEYPYYYIGVDSWLSSAEFTWSEYLPIYGGMVGSCPWSPSNNDSFYDLYPFPVNISLKMYDQFYSEWLWLQTEERYDITFNTSSPGRFTIYAYDVMLTVIKIIDEYIKKYSISSMSQFYERLYDAEAATIDEFKQILDEIWFIGLSGNVSYKLNGGGDRLGGLFSFCNVHPQTGVIQQIGFSFGGNIIINQEDIVWPLHYHNNAPKTAYKSYNGITTKNGEALPRFIWFCIFLSMFIVFIYVALLWHYRDRKIIKASQWQLSLCMAAGCVICYIALILFGIDESFPSANKLDYNWSVLCNFRMFLLNLSFSLIFLPLFTKIYRIKRIFNMAMVQLKRYQQPLRSIVIGNVIFICFDSILCIILMAAIPYWRKYGEGEIINHAATQWGSCSPQPFGYIYFIVLGVPKLIFSLYCIILSISVYSTVSMMKFNEGLQVLMCMIISVLLIFVTLAISSIITVDSPTNSIFFYSFISFILLMICNFCCAVMILPRLFAIWRDMDGEEYVNKNDEGEAVKKYMKGLRAKLNKLHVGSIHKGSSQTSDVELASSPTPKNIILKQLSSYDEEMRDNST